ncbi:hypothetical protein MRB53_037042 [Persea americana]|nr:hypothetical protein MRB53_037042 [Persea americana]
MIQLIRSLPRRYFFLLAFSIIILEPLYHILTFHVRRPAQSLDEPFALQCQEPDVDAPRENAVIVMLARNSEREKAVLSIESLEQQFNRWFNYPVVFLNDKPWDQDFLNSLAPLVSGDVRFETIDPAHWGYPPWIDQEKARKHMLLDQMGGVPYGGNESYHHMCRYNSGFFFDHPALLEYSWYWRIEPNIWFPCAITYDPFRKMAESKKKYGHTMALWEVGNTTASLFSHVSAYRDSLKQPLTDFWRSVVNPSWMPWIVRKFLSNLPIRDGHGDKWNLCEYFSNFEIASLDFFRSKQYRDFFAYLDSVGGIYYERVRPSLFMPRHELTSDSGAMRPFTRWQPTFFSILVRCTTSATSAMGTSHSCIVRPMLLEANSQALLCLAITHGARRVPEA